MNKIDILAVLIYMNDYNFTRFVQFEIERLVCVAML